MLTGNGGKDILPTSQHPIHGFWAGENLDWKCCAGNVGISMQKPRKGFYLLPPIYTVNSQVNSVLEAESWCNYSDGHRPRPLDGCPSSPASSIYCKHFCQSDEKMFKTSPCFLFLCLFFARKLLLPRTRKKHGTLNWKPWKISEPTC